MDGGYVDTDYRRRREGAFIVAVNCAQAAATCFCVSMESGPKATAGFDLALTEMLEDGGHVRELHDGVPHLLLPSTAAASTRQRRPATR